MATAATNRILCESCVKEKATAKCAGCMRNFCITHFTEHRRSLVTQFEDIEVNRDIFRQTILQLVTTPKTYPLMTKIDQWEQESIVKIRESAEEMRLSLTTHVTEHASRLEEKLNKLTEELRQSRQDDDIIETDLQKWKKDLEDFTEELNQPRNIKIQTNSTALINQLQIDIITPISLPLIDPESRWIQNGLTVVGGNGQNNGLNQLDDPWNVFVDDDQTVYVADRSNHRIVKWKEGAISGEVVAGGNGQGDRNDQLNRPVNVIIDKETDSLIICDYGNKRVVRWPRQNGTIGETIISNVNCWGLALDDTGAIYISDLTKQEVRCYEKNDTEGVLVAGGNGRGKHLDQLNGPYYIVVDRDRTVYISDCNNHRVVKWKQGARKGIMVAGDTDYGKGQSELSGPFGIVVDQMSTVYVADCNNNRIMRWFKGATEGSVVVGNNGTGKRPHQFNCPCALAFDQVNNLYVVDNNNHRVQRFNLDTN